MTSTNKENHPDLGVFNRRPMRYMGIKEPQVQFKMGGSMTKTIAGGHMVRYLMRKGIVEYWIQPFIDSSLTEGMRTERLTKNTKYKNTKEYKDYREKLAQKAIDNYNK